MTTRVHAPNRRTAALAAFVALLYAPLAHGDAESCTASHASGQREMKAGHLKNALEMFKECGADQSCPAPIRNECVEFFTSVQANVPTVVFSVTDAQGNDVTNVKVFSEDTLVQEGLDGRPVPVDPGKHEFHFELASGEALTSDVLIRQGEKDRIVAVHVAPKEEPGAPPATPAEEIPPVEPLEVEPEGPPTGFWIATGVSAAALGSWGVFALLGRGKQVDLVSCSPNCPASKHSDYDTMNRDYLIADISLGAAAVSAGVAAVILLTSGGKSPPPADRARSGESKPTFAVAPVPLGRQGGLFMLESRY